MRIFVPGIEKSVKLSAREAREERKKLLTASHSCFLDIKPKVAYVNELKHIARKNAEADEIAKGKKAVEDAEAAEKKRREPAELRKALGKGMKLPLEEWLMATYDVENVSSLGMRLVDSLEREFRQSKDGESYESLREKKILDLGCGSDMSHTDAGTYSKKGDFAPWLCRALHRCGAKPIGVDIKSNEGEPFEHIQADLSEPGALKALFDASHDSSFDAIVVVMFCKKNASPLLTAMTTAEERLLLEAEIIQDALRLLKDGGLFLFEMDRYRKNGNVLRLEHAS